MDPIAFSLILFTVLLAVVLYLNYRRKSESNEQWVAADHHEDLLDEALSDHSEQITTLQNRCDAFRAEIGQLQSWRWDHVKYPHVELKGDTVKPHDRKRAAEYRVIPPHERANKALPASTTHTALEPNKPGTIKLFVGETRHIPYGEPLVKANAKWRAPAAAKAPLQFPKGLAFSHRELMAMERKMRDYIQEGRIKWLCSQGDGMSGSKWGVYVAAQPHRRPIARRLLEQGIIRRIELPAKGHARNACRYVLAATESKVHGVA